MFVLLLLFLCRSYGSHGLLLLLVGALTLRLNIYRRMRACEFAQGRFQACCFGAPCHTGWNWVATSDVVGSLARPCHCRGRLPSVPRGPMIAATARSFAAACCPDLASVYFGYPSRGESAARYAAQPPKQLARDLTNLVMHLLVSDAEDMDEPLRPPHVAPRWVVELSQSTQFARRVSYMFRGSNHINIKEKKADGTLLRVLAREAPGTRTLVLQDSRVIIGASSKGRSSSSALNAEYLKTLPYVLGGCLYPSYFYVPSADNPADDQSRQRHVRRASMPNPQWLLDLLGGNPRRFDIVVKADKYRSPLNRWARFLGLLALKTFAPGPGATASPQSSASSVAAGDRLASARMVVGLHGDAPRSSSRPSPLRGGVPPSAAGDCLASAQTVVSLHGPTPWSVSSGAGSQSSARKRARPPWEEERQGSGGASSGRRRGGRKHRSTSEGA